MTYPGFEPGTFGLAVSIANHYTILVVSAPMAQWLILMIAYSEVLGSNPELGMVFCDEILIFQPFSG
jgi:hypothetical protein